MLDELDRNKGQIGRGIEQFANGTLDSTGTLLMILFASSNVRLAA